MWGIPRHMMVESDTRRTTMAIAVTAVHSKALDVILRRAQAARTGALTTRVIALPKNCWI